jgi:hypothetical protein
MVGGIESTKGQLEGLAEPIAANLALDCLGDIPTTPSWPR